jgi:hypothetical protein
MRAALPVRRGLKETPRFQMRISVGIRLRKHHASSDAMRLQESHSGPGLLGMRPGSEMLIQLILMLQTTSQSGKFLLQGPGRFSKRLTQIPPGSV